MMRKFDKNYYYIHHNHAIEIDITALTAQYDAYLREVEQNEVDKNKLKMREDY